MSIELVTAESAENREGEAKDWSLSARVRLLSDVSMLGLG